MFIVKNGWGTPVPGGVCSSKPLSFCSACKNLSRQRPHRGRNMVFRKSWFWWVQTHIYNFVVSWPKFAGLFSSNAGGIVVDTLGFRLWIISIRSWDIRDRSSKLSEITPNFARFSPPDFFGGGPPNLGTWIINLKILPSAWQSFTSIGDLAVKRRKEKKETSAVKHKPAWNYPAGWPN